MEPASALPERSIYTSGSYLESTGGTWHLEDSPAKARWIFEMMQLLGLTRAANVCEIGCGAGGILHQLEQKLPQTRFVGYEISPQAHEMSARFASDRCQFVLGDAFGDGRCFDLVLVMDVIEHVEDCFAFLRKTREKGKIKLYNIPLDTSASFTLRGFNQWDSVGHLHLFTLETALKSIEHSGQKVLHWQFAPSSFERQTMTLATRLMNLARASVSRVHERLAVRMFGGYSLLVAAE